MFNRKEQKHKNPFDREWNEIVYRRFDIASNIDKLFADIKYSTDVLLCFEKNSANWNAENKYLEKLKYKMLCECGSYDGTSYDLRDLWNKHKDDLQPQFCVDYMDLTANPPVDCNAYLRSAAKSFKKYGQNGSSMTYESKS